MLSATKHLPNIGKKLNDSSYAMQVNTLELCSFSNSDKQMLRCTQHDNN